MKTIIRVETAELCSCSNCRETGRVDFHKGWEGCSLTWDEMFPLEGVLDDGLELGDDDECRNCECGIVWILRYCEPCRRENMKAEKGDEDYQAAKEDRHEQAQW